MRLTLILPCIAFLGAACNEQKEGTPAPEPVSVAIEAVKVMTMPFTDRGSRWDNVSDADLYFTIESSQHVLYKYDVARRKENIQASDLPYSFNMNRYELPQVNGTYVVRLYDYDFPDGDDKIDEVIFSPGLYKSNRPHTQVITSAGTKLQLDLSWR